jgi:type I restriction enzyme, R subunit
MSSLGTERTTVQNPLIQYAKEIGWTYLSPDEALTLRRGAGGTLLYLVLRETLIALNPGVVSVENVDAIIATIESARNSIEGNAEILAWIRGERSVFVPAEKRMRNVVVVDLGPGQTGRNVFHVTEEWEYTNGRFTNRADVMFLVNGIPVALVETKSAKKREGIDEAVVQVRRYHRETPELVTAPQVFDVTHLLDFYYSGTWSLERKNLLNWKDEEPGNFEKKVKRFFARERFLKMLGEWIVFFKKDDDLKKIILRQHQTRAVDKVVERALDPGRRRGLVWHTQGSGKTFTMIKAAEQILRHGAFGKPTILMLVDRNELESQLFQNLSAYGLEARFAESKADLRELLGGDYRGLIVSTIHKFDGADADLCTRENVFVFVDEAHRSTGGDLGNYLVAALPNATMIGFTGTPIDRTAYGQGTFKVFGRDDAPKGYLDKYSIAESIQDGTTLELTYTLAPSEIQVPREILEKEFLALVEAEGVSDIAELNKILEHAVNLRTFLKAADRVDKVAQFVAKDFKEKVEPLGYKAFLVGVDREACALYKKALDKYLPAEYSVVVYTSAHNDSALLGEFKLDEQEETKLRRTFVQRDTVPKILIVTEKLLTGFDAPILYCMYLDKPMRDHTLLQAIARVNRPYEDENGVKKPVGFVVDFVGIFDKLEKALAFDNDEVASVIQNLDVLKERFGTLIREKAQPYLALCRGAVHDFNGIGEPPSRGRRELQGRGEAPSGSARGAGRERPSPPCVMDDKAVERAIETFAHKEAREAFYGFYREIESLYEIISPDVFMRPYVEAYGQLSVLYQVVVNAFSPRALLLKDLMKKTERLVQEHAGVYGLSQTLPLVRIDEKALEALRAPGSSDASKIINCGRSLVQAAIEDGGKEPYLIPIGERAEQVLTQYDERQVTTQETLSQLEALLKEYLEAHREHERLGLDTRTFTVYWVLKQEGVALPEEVAASVASMLERYPNHRDNADELRRLKADLYKVLLQAGAKEKMVALADRILRLGSA